MVSGPEITFVGVGSRDGDRYIGVMPPLNEDEIQTLEEASAFNSSQLEQFAGKPPCTIIRYYTEHRGADEFIDRHILGIAAELVANLKPLRGEVELISVVRPLEGPQNSPFNPNALPKPRRSQQA